MDADAMSRNGTIIMPFAGDERVFRLPWRELIQLQESRDAGPAMILARISIGYWRVEDIREIIRLGLQGGGMSATDALKLVRVQIEENPADLGGPDGFVQLAIRVLSAAIDGAPDEPLGESSAPIQSSESMISPTERSGSEPSTPLPH